MAGTSHYEALSKIVKTTETKVKPVEVEWPFAEWCRLKETGKPPKPPEIDPSIYTMAFDPSPHTLHIPTEEERTEDYKRRVDNIVKDSSLIRRMQDRIDDLEVMLHTTLSIVQNQAAVIELMQKTSKEHRRQLADLDSTSMRLEKELKDCDARHGSQFMFLDESCQLMRKDLDENIWWTERIKEQTIPTIEENKE